MVRIRYVRRFTEQEVDTVNLGPTGRAGEDAALEMLLKNGFELVARNYQTPYGEIDLIVRDDRYVVFVEVKTRTGVSRGSGYRAVNFRKKQKLFKTALLFLRENELTLQPRFDLIDIEGHWFVAEEKEQFAVDKMRWFKNAITAADYGGYI